MKSSWGSISPESGNARREIRDDIDKFSNLPWGIPGPRMVDVRPLIEMEIGAGIRLVILQQSSKSVESPGRLLSSIRLSVTAMTR